MDKRKSRNAKKSIMVLFLALLCAWTIEARAQKMVVGYSAVSALMAPYWVMKEAGLFKQEGLDTDLIYIPSSSTIAQAMLAGSVAISSANSQVVVDSGLGGGDLVAIGAVVNVAAFYVMAPPEIKRVEDLKGKRIGVTRFGASTDFGVRKVLVKYGLDPSRDVTIIQIGGMPELAAALSKRLIYAAPMSFPTGYVAQKAGIAILFNLAKEDIPFMHVGLTTSRAFLKDHRPQAKAFLRAYGKAVHFMHTRKEETLKILAQYTNIKDVGMLEGSLKYGYDFIEKIPLVKPQAFQTTLEEVAKKNPRAQQARAEQFYDNSLVEELNSEGFFKRLWGQ
jgi:NitT/TauT family transport system substrate-binding protein